MLARPRASSASSAATSGDRLRGLGIESRLCRGCAVILGADFGDHEGLWLLLALHAERHAEERDQAQCYDHEFGHSRFSSASSLARSVTVQPTGATPAYVAVALTPRDPVLDAMAFSRGRFLVEQAGMPTLVVPAWAEVGRVTEDCRR